MKINSIGIIGGTNGLGARLADHWRQQFPDLEVLVSGRKTKPSNQDLIKQCDLIVFAVPIQHTEAVIAECVPISRSDQIWTDITSVKQQPIAAMLESKAEVCGLHPLFGPLPVISGQPFIYCPERINEISLSAVLALLADFDIIEMTAQDHDDIMGVVQCVSHLSDFVMGETLRESGLDFETIWRVSSPSYRVKLQVMGRMFAQNPDLYIDIATLNQSGPDFTTRFERSLELLKNYIESGDRESLITKFDQIKNYLTPEFCETSYAASQQFMSLIEAEERTDNHEKTGQLAVFGARYSHTDQASQEFYPNINPIEVAYFSQVSDVFEAVDQGRFEAGIVPYENSTYGSVLDTLEALFKHEDVQIVSSQGLDIGQHLLGLSGSKLKNITKVSSHRQALAQGRDWLHKNLSKAQIIPARSTALAAQNLLAQQNLNQAVVGGSALAQGLGLMVLAENIQPPENITRFVEIRKRPDLVSNKKYLSLVFWFGDDQAGNLASVLQFMAEKQINLIKLDSRRASKEYGQYLFFVDAATSLENFDKLSNYFESIVSDYRILGTFDH